MLIHHKDRNTMNDSIENLELLTRAETLGNTQTGNEKKRARNAAEGVGKHAWRNGGVWARTWMRVIGASRTY